MKKYSVFFLSLLISVVLGVLVSCSDNTVPTPEMEKITESDSGTRSALSAPQNLVASQGGKRAISVSWNAVSKASRYYLYASNSLFEKFEQIGETTKNSFNYDNLAAGTTKYIKVCSVDYSGECSPLTDAVVGSTLAQPIISDIVEVAGYEDSAVTVHWYMENASFYADDLQYTITCKDSDGKQVESCNVYATELVGTSFIITNLHPSSNYFYSITAFLTSDSKVKETSEEVDAETARRMRPSSVEELTATQGTEKSQIVLSFKLPEKVDVLVAAKTYNQCPLYFKIFRRVYGTEDWGSAIVSHLYYNGTTEKPLKDGKFDEDSYVAGTQISWTDDSGIQRGVQYDYKVQSYADNTTRIITSDLSCEFATGWAAAIPTFEASYTYTQSEATEEKPETQNESVTVNFNASWETFDTEENWRFILKQAYSPSIEYLQSAIKTYKLFNSIEELNSTPKTISLKDDGEKVDESGYYQFSLIIVKQEDAIADGFTEPESKFLEVAENNTFFFTNIVNQPDMNSFTVKDGYTNKNVLSWTYDESCTYTLQRKTLTADGEMIEDSIKNDFVFDFSGLGDAANYTFEDKDLVESGKIYSYTLYATKEGKNFPSKAIVAKTLGTPAPKFIVGELAYDSITISWPKVQQAEYYDIALYDGDAEVPLYANENQEESAEMSIRLNSEKIAGLESGGAITFKISAPYGYNDATISGKKLTVKITAISAEDKDNISADEQVNTFGPAATELKASKATDSSKITLTWKEVDGAAGYTIQRIRYNIPESGSSETPQRTDLFYVSSDGTITYGETAIDESVMEVSFKDGEVKLFDKQVEHLSNDGYETSQALISSGLPYEYTVLPVLDSEDASSVDSFVINYENSDKIASRGSTHGFGHNITATKAEFMNKIDVSWNKPADSDGLTPVLYKRLISSTDSTSNSSGWQKVDKIFASDDTIYTDTLGVSEANVYEYAVKYGEANFSKTYLNLLASRKTALEEPENRGYAFNVNYTAGKGTDEDFSEILNWIPFDSSLRKAAHATSYEIWCKNTNYPQGWQKIATLDDTGKRTEGYTSSTNFGNSGDFNVAYEYEEKMPNRLKIKPVKATAKIGEVTGGGSYEGLLKVLRDPRHYYKIVMKGERTSDGSSYEAVTFDPSSEDVAEDMTIYACRQITDAEIIRSALCVMAYGFYIEEGGQPDLSNTTTKLGYEGDKTLSTDNGGTAVFEGRDLISALIWNSEVGKYKANVSMTNYAPSQLTPSGVYSTWLKISMSNVSTRTAGLSDPYLDKFRTEDFTVTVGTVDSDLPINYSATLTMSCTGSKNLIVKMKDKSILNISDSADQRRSYFPIQIDDNHCWLKSTDYGWWEE